MMKIVKFIIPAMIIGIAACNSGNEGIKPEYRKLTEAVYASGYIMPQDEYQLYALAEGYIARKLVKDGAEVTSGEPLFIISSDQQSARYQNALDIYDQAQRDVTPHSPILSELRIALEQAEVKMQNDSMNYFRQKELLANDATALIEYERAKLTYSSSRNEYRIRKQQFVQMQEQLQLKVKNAQNQLTMAADDKNNHILKSGIDGMVYQTMKEEGELVRRGEPVALIGRKDSVYIKLSVDELDIQRVELGQDILVKIDVYGDRTFMAKVKKIYPMLNRKEQSFRVDAIFTEPIPAHYSGLSVEANIIIDEKEKALTIPRSYITNNDSIWIMKDGEERKVGVKRGLETLEHVEITAGIDTQTLIIAK